MKQKWSHRNDYESIFPKQQPKPSKPKKKLEINLPAGGIQKSFGLIVADESNPKQAYVSNEDSKYWTLDDNQSMGKETPVNDYEDLIYLVSIVDELAPAVVGPMSVRRIHKEPELFQTGRDESTGHVNLAFGMEDECVSRSQTQPIRIIDFNSRSNSRLPRELLLSFYVKRLNESLV